MVSQQGNNVFLEGSIVSGPVDLNDDDVFFDLQTSCEVIPVVCPKRSIFSLILRDNELSGLKACINGHLEYTRGCLRVVAEKMTISFE